MKDLHTEAQVKEAIQNSTPTVLLWSADWCPDCLYLNPHLDRIEKDNPEFNFYHLNRDELLDLAIEQEVLGIPSFITFKDGKEVSRFVSTRRKTPEEVREFLDKSKKEIEHGKF